MPLHAPPDVLHGKILIVDDQPANILLLEGMLRGAGYACFTSTTEPREVKGKGEMHTWFLNGRKATGLLPRLVAEPQSQSARSRAA